MGRDSKIEMKLIEIEKANVKDNVPMDYESSRILLIFIFETYTHLRKIKIKREEKRIQ